MRDEYKTIFKSLFKSESRHMSVIRALGTRKTGMTRDELLARLGDFWCRPNTNVPSYLHTRQKVYVQCI